MVEEMVWLQPPLLEQESCGCRLCKFLETYNGIHGGWADPRRGYSESEEDFIERVPDGFLTWPDDHVDTYTSPFYWGRWRNYV
jgi:hypothetical protein